MQFSEQWLRTWVNPNLSSEDLAHLLTMAGLEVEEVSSVAPEFSKVVVAEVKALCAHENADRLRVAQVDVGSGELLQIVCGAPNIALGVKVPCALSGAILPGNFKIKPTKMRGVESNGMLCSAKELGIDEDADGLLLLDSTAPVGVDIREYLQLNDNIFTLKITPNRADCLSIKGIAREVAALTSSPCVEPEISEQPIEQEQILPVTILAKEACGRYVGRIISTVNTQAKTPEWMISRLSRSGLRSVSAIVDITNYVMLELGQPLHAFDFAKISGGIEIRMGRKGEKLLCLNDKTVDISESTLLVADEEKVLSLAGIMGGKVSSVTDSTCDIFIESAWFVAEAIAGRSREYGFSSDASYRYERGVDSKLQIDAIKRASELILLICGGRAAPISEWTANLPSERKVLLRSSRISRVLGVNIETKQISDILRRLGFNFNYENNEFSVDVPSFRMDINLEEDLIEEIARVYGYENIPDKAPNSTLRMLPIPDSLRPESLLRRILVQRDYQEVICYSFVDEKWEHDFAANQYPIRLINPIASQMSVMRSTLFGSLVDALLGNINRKHLRVRIFELARVFSKNNDDFNQDLKLSGLAWGDRRAEQWADESKRVDFFDVKSDVEALIAPRKANFIAAEHPALHPGRTAKIFLDDKEIGVIGELHPRLVQAYSLLKAPILFELDIASLQYANRVKAQSIPKSQAVRRDLSLVVKHKISADNLLNVLRKAAPAVVSEISVFDLYQGAGIQEGYKSLAFRVQMQDVQKTLTDEEIDQVMATLLQSVTLLGAKLRS